MALIKKQEEAERLARRQREEEAARRALQREAEEAARQQAELERKANARRIEQIEREEAARRQQLEVERKARLEAEETARRQAEVQRQGAQVRESPRQSAGAPRQLGGPRQPTGSHPERFLNQLSPSDQALFLQHFSVLNLEQQTYAYNQFLSTPPEIQKFAISQFLSLEPEVLIVSIQAEIDREASLVADASTPQFQPRPAAPAPLRAAAPPRAARRRSDSGELDEGGPSPDEQRAIRHQLDQQAQARKTLKQIIDRQTEVNRRHLMGSVAQ